MLEEIGFEYAVKKMDLSKGDQFKDDFKEISPFSKIPAIIDHSNNKESVFESGAILIYLAEKSGKFNKGLSEVGEKRYFEMTKKVYEVLENHLSKNDYLAGENYSIADIATWPWIARHQWHDIGLKNYNNLCDWYIRISERPAVVKGYKFLDKNSEIPKP